MFVCLAIVGCGVELCSAQADSKRKRFKHEKHGAIVFDKGSDYELKCDIYQPKSDQPRPVMLAIHGGAWTTGTKFAMFRHARILANRGYVVMAFNYRLAPDHKWPAQIHDCKHAVRWIRENAAKYNADPNRVYAFGYSAGGHLAALLATTDKDDELEGDVVAPFLKHSSRIDGLIAGGSPMEFSWVGEDSTSLSHWLDTTRGSDPEKYKQASPTTYISKDDPVAVLYHGESDALVPTSSPKKFFERYQEAGIDVEMIVQSGGHASAFTQTTLLIRSLAKLESMLAKQKCRAEIAKLAKLAKAFVAANGAKPDSDQAFKKFALESQKMESGLFEELRNNERDGKPFEIGWDGKDGVVVGESVGVDGEKLSNRN